MKKRCVSGLLVGGLVAAMLPAVALGAGPTRVVTDLDDPAEDAAESSFATALCGFEVEAEISGHIISMSFPAGGRSVQQIDAFNIRGTYTNTTTGASIRLRDAGPDRFFVKDGNVYVAVAGRSSTGTGVIGNVVFDLDTFEIIRSAGNEIGNFYDQLCAAIA